MCISGDAFSTPFRIFINVRKHQPYLQATFQGFVTLKYKLNRFSFGDASYSSAIKALLIPLSTRIKNIKNVTRCRDSRSVKSIETR